MEKQDIARALGGDSSAMQELLDSLPAWRNRPTKPGIYIAVADRGGFGPCVLDLEAEGIKRGQPYHAKRVYGPIPKDEGQ